MRGYLLLSLALTFLSALADEMRVDFFRDIEILAWPASSPKPQSLAQISYNYRNASIKSYKPPQIPDDEDVIRIGFLHPSSGAWSGVATAASNFAAENINMTKRLQLHVSPNGEIYHVGFTVSEGSGVSQGSRESSKDGLSVEVVESQTGPTPILNKPVVVTEDGQVEGKEPEKTFLQKYWWAIGLFLLLQVTMAGGKDEEAPKK